MYYLLADKRVRIPSYLSFASAALAWAQARAPKSDSLENKLGSRVWQQTSNELSLNQIRQYFAKEANHAIKTVENAEILVVAKAIKLTISVGSCVRGSQPAIV